MDVSGAKEPSGAAAEEASAPGGQLGTDTIAENAPKFVKSGKQPGKGKKRGQPKTGTGKKGVGKKTAQGKAQKVTPKKAGAAVGKKKFSASAKEGNKVLAGGRPGGALTMDEVGGTKSKLSLPKPAVRSRDEGKASRPFKKLQLASPATACADCEGPPDKAGGGELVPSCSRTAGAPRLQAQAGGGDLQVGVGRSGRYAPSGPQVRAPLAPPAAAAHAAHGLYHSRRPSASAGTSTKLPHLGSVRLWDGGCCDNFPWLLFSLPHTCPACSGWPRPAGCSCWRSLSTWRTTSGPTLTPRQPPPRT